MKWEMFACHTGGNIYVWSRAKDSTIDSRSFKAPRRFNQIWSHIQFRRRFMHLGGGFARSVDFSFYLLILFICRLDLPNCLHSIACQSEFPITLSHHFVIRQIPIFDSQLLYLDFSKGLPFGYNKRNDKEFNANSTSAAALQLQIFFLHSLLSVQQTYCWNFLHPSWMARVCTSANIIHFMLIRGRTEERITAFLPFLHKSSRIVERTLHESWRCCCNLY